MSAWGSSDSFFNVQTVNAGLLLHARQTEEVPD